MRILTSILSLFAIVALCGLADANGGIAVRARINTPFAPSFNARGFVGGGFGGGFGFGSGFAGQTAFLGSDFGQFAGTSCGAIAPQVMGSACGSSFGFSQAFAQQPVFAQTFVQPSFAFASPFVSVATPFVAVNVGRPFVRSRFFIGGGRGAFFGGRFGGGRINVRTRVRVR